MTGGPDEIRDVYERRAERYDSNRSRAFFEARWLSRFADTIRPNSRVLDLGCGAGQPIAEWLIGEGFRLTGLDFSDAMLAIARRRRPHEDWRLGDMRSLELDERFGGIIAWDSFFHLSPDDQRAALPRFARHLEPGGVLMVTVGPDAGEAMGQIEGEPVYHASLSAADYAVNLEAAGLRMVSYMAEDPYCDRHSVLMARRDTK